MILAPLMQEYNTKVNRLECKSAIKSKSFKYRKYRFKINSLNALIFETTPLKSLNIKKKCTVPNLTY